MPENIDYATFTESQLVGCINEMRKRGWAVAAYAVGELGEGPLAEHDGSYDEAKVKAYLDENRDGLEEAMCDGVWRYVENDN